jgi:hypothetical protein
LLECCIEYIVAVVTQAAGRACLFDKGVHEVL